MTTQTPSLSLAEAIFPQIGLALRVKQLVLVVAGITALILAAKIKIPMFPVPMTMGTFAVLSIGAAYGARLGLATILGCKLPQKYLGQIDPTDTIITPHSPAGWIKPDEVLENSKPESSEQLARPQESSAHAPEKTDGDGN